MSIMLDCGVTTAWAVLMGVIFMCFAIAHSNAFLFHLLEQTIDHLKDTLRNDLHKHSAK